MWWSQNVISAPSISTSQASGKELNEIFLPWGGNARRYGWLAGDLLSEHKRSHVSFLWKWRATSCGPRPDCCQSLAPASLISLPYFSRLTVKGNTRLSASTQNKEAGEVSWYVYRMYGWYEPQMIGWLAALGKCDSSFGSLKVVRCGSWIMPATVRSRLFTEYITSERVSKLSIVTFIF